MTSAGNNDPRVALLSPIPCWKGRTNLNYSNDTLNTKVGLMRKMHLVVPDDQYKTDRPP